MALKPTRPKLALNRFENAKIHLTYISSSFAFCANSKQFEAVYFYSSVKIQYMYKRKAWTQYS